MIEIELDPVDLTEEPLASFPPELERGVGSFRNFRVRDGSHKWVARVASATDDWLEGVFDIGLPGLVVVCAAGPGYLVSTADPTKSVCLPAYPIVGFCKGSRDLPGIFYLFDDMMGIRRDGSWWVVGYVSPDGIRAVRVKRETVYFEVWLPWSSCWDERKIRVATGIPPVPPGENQAR